MKPSKPEDLASLRVEYSCAQLDEASVEPDPVRQFQLWFEQAVSCGLKEPNAMSLATVDELGRPNCRMVLLKGFDHEGFVFYTNYGSMKGAELKRSPWAALVLYWPELERQVRLRGAVSETSEEESDEYFGSRPLESRRAAAASPQSQVIPSRGWLEARMREVAERTVEGSVPRPEHWGGYRLSPESFEFWQGRQGRLHDRILYSRAAGGWRIERLAP